MDHRGNWSKDAPIAAMEFHSITAERYSILVTLTQLTSSPEEDWQFAVKTSQSTSHVTEVRQTICFFWNWYLPQWQATTYYTIWFTWSSIYLHRDKHSNFATTWILLSIYNLKRSQLTITHLRLVYSSCTHKWIGDLALCCLVNIE